MSETPSVKQIIQISNQIESSYKEKILINKKTLLNDHDYKQLSQSEKEELIKNLAGIIQARDLLMWLFEKYPKAVYQMIKQQDTTRSTSIYQILNILNNDIYLAEFTMAGMNSDYVKDIRDGLTEDFPEVDWYQD